MEKIRDIPVTVTPVTNSDKCILKLLIPNHIVDKLGIKSTKESGRRPTLYISPSIDKIKLGDTIDLLYRFPGYDMNVSSDGELTKQELTSEELEDEVFDV